MSEGADDERRLKSQMLIGGNIKQLRLERGLSQAELSRKSRVSRSCISDIENGKVNTTLEMIKRIADGLEVPLSKVFAGL